MGAGQLNVRSTLLREVVQDHLGGPSLQTGRRGVSDSVRSLDPWEMLESYLPRMQWRHGHLSRAVTRALRSSARGVGRGA